MPFLFKITKWLVVISLIVFFSLGNLFVVKAEMKTVSSDKFLGLNNQEKILSIPTYDGLNQAVHPDILFFPNKFNSYFYYLVFTPYPNSKDRYENPSILGSNDGLNFKELKKGLNPLVKAPKKDHNDDPDIFFDETNKTFYLYYLETERPLFQNLVLLTSTNTLNWQKETLLTYELKKGDEFILSPSIVKKGNLYYLFYVARERNKLAVKYYVSFDPKIWDQNNSRTIIANWPIDFHVWHLNIIETGGQFYMLANGMMDQSGGQKLIIGRSRDLKNWYFKQEPIIAPGENFLNTHHIYRSAGLVRENDLTVWFSFQDQHDRWGIGLKKFKLNKIFSDWREVLDTAESWIL